MSLTALRKDLRRVARPAKAKALQWFFKTGPGEYAEGDKFLGVVVPDSRKVARRYRSLPLGDARALLRSPWHEERLVALLILVEQFRRGDQKTRKAIYDLYLRHTKYVNNWDLVDSSAEHIVGPWLATRSRAPLRRLARSRSVWERRIAIIATLYFIWQRDYAETLRIAELLLDDKHDLIHKATGWMLREVGNRDRAVEERFLRQHARRMPRTMLRYAIEKFPERKRQAYLRM